MKNETFQYSKLIIFKIKIVIKCFKSSILYTYLKVFDPKEIMYKCHLQSRNGRGRVCIEGISWLFGKIVISITFWECIYNYGQVFCLFSIKFLFY